MIQIFLPPTDYEVSIKNYVKSFNPDFEVFLHLIPFLKWPKFNTHEVETISQIQTQLYQHGYADKAENYVTWADLVKQLDLKSTAYLYWLRYCILWSKEVKSQLKTDIEKLESYAEMQNLQLPFDGDFSGLLEACYYRYLIQQREVKVWLSDEFGDERQEFLVSDLIKNVNSGLAHHRVKTNLHLNLTMISIFDTFYNLIIGYKDDIENFLDFSKLEGFWVDDEKFNWGTK